MQINSSFQFFKNTLKTACLCGIISSTSIKAQQDYFEKQIPKITTQKTEINLAPLNGITYGLKKITVTNCSGGVSHCYNDSSVKVLQQRILNKKIPSEYTSPIDTNLKPYIDSSGLFGSPRPFDRPHLGVDIYTTPNGIKPEKPVAILATTNGIVVSNKKARENDNVISNHIKIMGTDGKMYSFDHLAKASDYPNAKEIPLKKLGTIVKTNDTLGYMGATGETEFWHLHFSVEDISIKDKQKRNPEWQKLNKKHKTYALPNGQLDPLDSIKAGTISKILNKYKIEKGEIMPIIKKL